MEISIEPEPGPEEREALLAALGEREAPVESPWRRAALEEGVEPYPD